MRKEFDKLIRDKIPEIISNKGVYTEYEVIDDDSYIRALEKKLLGECNEVINATSEKDKIEELADLLEVIIALSKFMSVDFETVDKIRLKKKAEKGGFNFKFFLKSTELVNL